MAFYLGTELREEVKAETTCLLRQNGLFLPARQGLVSPSSLSFGEHISLPLGPGPPVPLPRVCPLLFTHLPPRVPLPGTVSPGPSPVSLPAGPAALPAQRFPSLPSLLKPEPALPGPSPAPLRHRHRPGPAPSPLLPPAPAALRSISFSFPSLSLLFPFSPSLFPFLLLLFSLLFPFSSLSLLFLFSSVSSPRPAGVDAAFCQSPSLTCPCERRRGLGGACLSTCVCPCVCLCAPALPAHQRPIPAGLRVPAQVGPCLCR